MADHTVAGFGKDPLVTSHGDALADQSFQSLKSKEIRDSLSPTEMKFQSMALNNPNTTGWNVQSSKEVSPDGRGFRAETLATTDGVESINGGIAEFKGRNEQRSSAHHQGDDKNFIKKAMESSNSHLQEKVVIGDENSGHTEVRTSSTKSSSSSQVIESSTNVEYDDGYPIQQQAHPQKYLTDSSRQYQQDLQQRQHQEKERLLEEQRVYEQQFQQQRQQHLNQQEQSTTEQVSKTHQNTQQKNISQNIQTQETHEQNKRYVDMDKASPEYQQHVQYLMQQPGEIISSTVEYPKPNVKMITTVKRLPDGTIVRNKRYETEELNPTPSTTRPTSTSTNQAQPRRASQQPSKSYQSSQDMVDNSSPVHYVQNTHTDDVETKFSSIKKSSNKFATETTSETVQEVNDHHTQSGTSNRPKPKTNDFSTHGFPSVRSNKPTERPHTAHPTQGYPSQSSPFRPTEAVAPRYTDNNDNITERRVNTKDGEVIIVSSEKKHNFKTSTNSERIIESEHVIHDDHGYPHIPQKAPHDFSTHGFPSVREPTTASQPKKYVSEKQMQPHEQDFPLDKFSTGTRIINKSQLPRGNDDVVVISSERSHTAKHSTNTERVIEHEITRDNQQRNYPQVHPNKQNVTPHNYTVTTPGEQIPAEEFLVSPRKPYDTDYSTQEFPSAKTPGYVIPNERGPYKEYPAGTSKHPTTDYSTQGYPSVKTPTKPAAGLPSAHNQHPSLSRKSPSQDYSTQGFPSVRSPSKGTPSQGYPSNVDGGRPNGAPEQPRASPTIKSPARTPSPNKYKVPNNSVRETTERIIKKEKEVDSAHRAFAASLRSSSPIDHIRRDSYVTDSHSRHTPRSSVSSTKTFRRDTREGSHDSAPSETSRVSTTTITRNTPPRVVGSRTVVTKLVSSKTGPGSNDALNVTSPRDTKSPSPGKTVTTTTTTTRTLTNKDVPKVTEPSTKKPLSHPHTKTTKMSKTTTDSVAARRSLFEGNNDSTSQAKRTPLTSPMSGRRPSYMDHTKSSLEHTRRDSLEINKTNYSRKTSQMEEDGTTPDRNSTVKFDVPHGKRATTPRATSVTEDINVEEIFDLDVLEKLLETVQSYEIRRRIRAQIRLIKKNQKNEIISSSSTEVTTNTVKTTKVGAEETDNVTTTSRKPKTGDKIATHPTQAKEPTTKTKKEYIFEEAYLPISRKSTKPNRYPYEAEKEQERKPTRSQSPQSPVCNRKVEHERNHHSPDHQQHTQVVSTSKQQYYYKDEHEQEEIQEIKHESSPTRKSPSPNRKQHSLSSSPERRYASPESHRPLKTYERSRSPQTKSPQSNRVTCSRSPDIKNSTATVRKSSSSYEQQETVKTATAKPQTKRITTTTTTTATTKSKPEDKTPVWADRKNILKAPSSATPKKPSSSNLESRSGYMKSSKSTTNQKMASNKPSSEDDDCVTSSYGIGPTDENGLPLFGIRALKKKKSTVEPSETTEEVTGYVVEEKYYSDNKSKPTVERKEFIYSTNPEELKKLKHQVEVTSNRKALKDVELKESRQATLISKGTPALRSSPEDDFLDSTTKYVRRGSVKEMSEKFIQKEASSTVIDKSNSYPKAGLILRTNSRKNSKDIDNENDNFESYKTTRVQQQYPVLGDSDDNQQEYEVEEVASQHSGRFITESESECDSIKTQREFKKVTSSSSSSKASRSFLNSRGEEKIVANVSDCLERMRNADNVVEEGDTTEDQEARALLNKFLGASIIMKGVESSLPATNRQSKIITTTTTSCNLSDDDNGDNNAKHELKTTRITKTFKSGSSSTPVTYTTCDIEEIWDEEILKELLEQARTYEERRKIRSRLRELMADREDMKF